MKPRGRPRKYADYDALVANISPGAVKRPRYLRGIGVFRGATGDTVWLKIRLPHGGTYQGKHYQAGASLEIKLGKLSSWSWEALEQKRDDLQGRADRGEALEDFQAPNFEDWAADWLNRAKTRLRSYEIVEVHVRTQLVPAFGSLRVDEIEAGQVNQWVAGRLTTAAPATTKREFSTLSAILGSAVKAGLLLSNPCRKADPIRGVVGRQRFLDGQEILRLLAAAEMVSDWMPDLLLWCLHSGMRKGEILRLRWGDVRPLADGRQIVQVATTKTDRPRYVVSTATMAGVLDRQRTRQVGPIGDDQSVFPIASMTLRRHWGRTRKLAGLEDVTLHDLRRTHSTHAVAAGVDLRTLADRIGHGSLTMLQRHYAAVVGSAAADAAQIFQATFDTLTSHEGYPHPNGRRWSAGHSEPPIEPEKS